MPDTNIMTADPAPSPYRNRSVEIKDLAAALVKAQAELSGAKKGAKAVITGQQTRTYADLASVWEAIREPLTDNGLCVVQFPRTAGNGVEIETTLLHGATGQFMADVLWVPCGKNDAQGLGSAITYGRRYALMAVVGVCPVDDDGAAAVASHKPGAAGTAGAGGDFRPDGPRRFTPPTHQNGVRQASVSGARMAAEEPESVARANGRMKGELAPRPATNAVEHMGWIKDARKLIEGATTKGELSDWWRQTEEQREGAATAVPVEYDKLIVLFDEKMTAVAQAGA